MMQKKHRIHSLQRVRLVETDRICTVVWAAEGKGNGTACIRDVTPALEAGNVMALYGVDSKKNQIRWYRRFIL